jgi:hypothetical protein
MWLMVKIDKPQRDTGEHKGSKMPGVPVSLVVK